MLSMYLNDFPFNFGENDLKILNLHRYLEFSIHFHHVRLIFLSIQKTILHVNTIGIANDSINRNQIASDKTMKN